MGLPGSWPIHWSTVPCAHTLVKAALKHEWCSVYGAVEPTTGERFFLELPYLNAEGFQVYPVLAPTNGSW
jgi:hypothetical protein